LGKTRKCVTVSELHTASREALLEIVLQQQEQITVLLTRVAALEVRVAELEEENRQLRKGGGKAVPAWVKPNRLVGEKKDRKRRGQAFVRRREAHPDEIHEHALERCPDCGHRFTGGWEHRRRQVIEILPPRVRVIEHVVVARRCGICKKHHVPKLESRVLGVQGKRRFGVSVQALVALLHGRYRVPMKELRRLLRELCGLRISDGEIVALLDGVVAAGEPELARLQEAGAGLAGGVCRRDGVASRRKERMAVDLRHADGALLRVSQHAFRHSARGGAGEGLRRDRLVRLLCRLQPAAGRQVRLWRTGHTCSGICTT